jgi:site-specific recombinase XerD
MATVTIQKYSGKTKTSYIVRFKDPVIGKFKHYKTFQRKRDAQFAANNLRTLIDNGKVVQINKWKAKLIMLTFEQVNESLKSYWASKLERKELSSETYAGYVCRANVLNRIFGKNLICEIQADDILKFQNAELYRNSPASSNRYLFNIKQIFKHAIELGVVLENPAETVKYLSEKIHERNTFIGPTLIEKLVDASQSTRSKFYMPALIFLGAEHGTAKQEALSLSWDDIDFDFEGKGLIRFFRTKNRHERTEYLMPRSRQALIDWRDHLALMRCRKKITPIRCDQVFSRLNGLPIKRFDKAWRRTCKISGIDDFHYHDLRHTYCSNLILSGSDLKDVKEMIGHSELAMTDRYSHLTNKHKQFRQDELARYYENGI